MDNTEVLTANVLSDQLVENTLTANDVKPQPVNTASLLNDTQHDEHCTNIVAIEKSSTAEFEDCKKEPVVTSNQQNKNEESVSSNDSFLASEKDLNTGNSIDCQSQVDKDCQDCKPKVLTTNCSMDQSEKQQPIISKSKKSLNDSSKSESSDFKSEDEYSGPSPNLSEELSHDSGVALLDEQDNTQSNNGISSEKGNVTQNGKKRFHSSLSHSSKRRKRPASNEKMVSFSGVTVFYFSRRQSFITVPSQGGSTLGMALAHNAVKEMSLKQHRKAVLQRRKTIAREQSRQQRISIKIKQLKQSYPNLETCQLMPMVVQSEPQEESSDSSSGSDLSADDDDEETDDNYFLQPIPTKKRRLLLRMSGVQKIDSEEKLSNKLTRESREVCGCKCIGVCLPATCLCAQSEIPCQVDRESFPCGCTAAGCENPYGRIEFDSDRVRKHHIRTMQRVCLEETGDIRIQSLDETIPAPKISPYVDQFKMDSQISTASTNTSIEFATSTAPSIYTHSATQYNQSNNVIQEYLAQDHSSTYCVQPTDSTLFHKQDCWGNFQENAHTANCPTTFIPFNPNPNLTENMENFQYNQPEQVNHTQPDMLQTLCGTTQPASDGFSPYPMQSQYNSNLAPVCSLSPLARAGEVPLRLEPIASFFSQSIDVSNRSSLLMERSASNSSPATSALQSLPLDLACSNYCSPFDKNAPSVAHASSNGDQLSSVSCTMADCNNDPLNAIA